MAKDKAIDCCSCDGTGYRNNPDAEESTRVPYTPCYHCGNTGRCNDQCRHCNPKPMIRNDSLLEESLENEDNMRARGFPE